MPSANQIVPSSFEEARRQTSIGPHQVSRPRENQLQVGTKTFALCWWTVAVLHACDSVFLAAMTRLYCWLLKYPALQINMLAHLNLSMSYNTLRMLNWLFAAMACLQTLALLWIMVLSFRARELTFHGTNIKVTRSRSREKDESNATIKTAGHRLTEVTTPIHQTIVVQWIEPVFSIEGAYFDSYYLFVEYLEMISQTYQAYHMSFSIPTTWINHVFVGLIFVNGVSTPLIHWLLPKKNQRPLRRLISLMTSTLLNVVNAVGIPLLIIWPYVHEYTPSNWFFPNTLGYDDVWFPKAILENHQLFVTSYVDFVTTLVPHWSILLCLWTCESMVFRRQTTKAAVVSVPAVVQPFANSSAPPNDLMHSLAKSWASDKSLHSASAGQSRSFVRLVSRVRRLLGHNLLWIAGVLVLIIHIVAQSAEQISGCKLQQYPWFTTNSFCVVLNINCHRRGIQGYALEIEQVLSKLDRATVFSIILSHCRHLEVPPIIQSFNKLTGFEIYNSTVAQWGQEASLNQDAHPALNYVSVLRSNLFSFPKGLQDPLPETIYDVELVHTNLTALPSNLHVKWYGVTEVLLEFGLFTEVPATLYHLLEDSIYVSLAGNRIEAIDESIFTDTLRGLQLRNSTLREFSRLHPTESIGAGLAELEKLDLRYTNLAQVPGFIHDWFWSSANQSVEFFHSLFGSPYCNRQLQDEQEREYQTQVCPETDDIKSGLHPMTIIDPQRPL